MKTQVPANSKKKKRAGAASEDLGTLKKIIIVKKNR